MNASHTRANPSDSPDLSALVLRRSLDLVLGQSRLGYATAIVVALLLGTVFVPAAGWFRYGAWFVPVALGFTLRQVWFEHLRRSNTSNERQLTWITSISAFTGWLAILCVPQFVPHLPQDEASFVFALMISWIAAAVSVLGVQPKVYGMYLCVALPTALYPMTLHSGVPAVLVGAVCLGGYMMFRLALGIRALLVEAVATGQRSEELAHDLERAMQEQKAAFLSRSRFLAAASHDLRQPVHALALLVNVLKKTQVEERRVEVTLEIERTAQSIQSMFRSLLDMAQIDADSLHAKVQQLDVLPLMQTVLAGYRDRCQEKGLRLQVSLPTACAVRADALLLERVLRNLLDNALKYTQRGHITLSVIHEDEHVVIALEDTGVGMTPEDLEHLYQPFRRGLSSRGSATDGLGLGLAIARHMAEEMGVRLAITSKAGAGTTATLHIPSAPQVFVGESTNPIPTVFHAEHVLLVEDDDKARQALRLWLQEAGARVSTAASGAQALDWLQREAAPDLLMVDHSLDPGPDGLALIEAFRARHPHLPVLLISGEDNLPPLPAHIPLLKKPVTPDDLANVLISLLNRQEPTHARWP
jgi:signal transduction histidine kinase/CheY-like chemotaxis protein